MNLRMHAVSWIMWAISGSACATGIMMSSLCRPELVPEVKRAYEQLGGWMRPGQLPLIYHPVYNIGMSSRSFRRALAVALVRMSAATDFVRPAAVCAAGKSRGRTCVFS